MLKNSKKSHSNLVSREHQVRVPLNHDKKKSPKIDLFCREFHRQGNQKKEIFVFLQGGPGFASPRNLEQSPGLKVLLDNYRVVLLDQRGTGRSNKIGPDICNKFPSPKEQADYFSNFRADQIIKDLEFLREKIFKVKKWFLIGQSYGGFITYSYISYFPKSIKGAILCGGIPPILHNPKEIYQTLTNFIHIRNKEFYQQFPKAKKKIRLILDQLLSNKISLPDKGFLTPERFLDIGMMLGQTNGLKRLNDFLEDPFISTTEKGISYYFNQKIVSETQFETNPIYAVLHESIYANNYTTNWAADQILTSDRKFSPHHPTPSFYGETIRKNMFKEYAMLKPYQKAANILAKKKWGPLYDLNQLANNKVPIEAIAYQTDYYVNDQLSLEVKNFTPNCNVWRHPIWQHDGLRIHGKEIVEKLLKRLIKRV